MSEKCHNNNNNTDNPLTFRHTNGGKNRNIRWGLCNIGNYTHWVLITTTSDEVIDI